MVIKVVEVNRNGFSPAESEDEEHQSSDGVKMFARVQAQAPQPPGGRVAHLIRHPAVGQLVDDDRIQERDDQKDKSGRISEKQAD